MADQTRQNQQGDSSSPKLPHNVDATTTANKQQNQQSGQDSAKQPQQGQNSSQPGQQQTQANPRQGQQGDATHPQTDKPGTDKNKSMERDTDSNVSGTDKNVKK